MTEAFVLPKGRVISPRHLLTGQKFQFISCEEAEADFSYLSISADVFFANSSCFEEIFRVLTTITCLLIKVPTRWRQSGEDDADEPVWKFSVWSFVYWGYVAKVNNSNNKR